MSAGEVTVGGTYRHYKNRELYRVVTLALLEATLEPLVIYECLYPNDRGQIWARPRTDFLAEVTGPGYAGPRFALVSTT